MNFFEAQDQARRKSYHLVALFVLAVVGIIIAVYLAVLLTLGFGFDASPGFDLGMFVAVAVGTGVLIGGGSLYRWSKLRRGGPAVATLLGGRRVEPDTRDPDERRLVNVVEEMSLASGMPVPAIFVLDRESSINAFAAGYGIHDAAVAVTRGTLERLNRDELQGVVAHEFSHILNGDMRLNIRLVGLLFGILLLAVVGRGIMRGAFWGRRRDRSGGRTVLLGLALVALGYIGVFFGKLIKAAVSRQREFLADAAAVQFTRDPAGIAGALKKIGAHASGSRIQDHHAEEMSHLFFANGLGSSVARLTSTHPPLEERISRVDPSWDGLYPAEAVRTDKLREDPQAARKAAEAADKAPGDGGRGPFPFGLPEASGGTMEGAGLGATLGAAAVLLEAVGSPGPEHVAYARELLASIPRRLRDASHDAAEARILVLCLLGGTDDKSQAARRAGAKALDGTADGPSTRLVEEFEPLAARLPAEARLPMVDLALPTLDRMSPEDAATFRSAAERVIRADGTIRPFDFALMHILWRHLPGAVDPGRRTSKGVRSLADARADVETLLSVLAWRGADRPEEVEAAFQAGAGALADELEGLALRAEDEVGMARVDQALERLEGAPLAVRRRLLEAAAAVVYADRLLLAEEVELLRAVAECMEIPLPPLLARPASRETGAGEGSEQPPEG